MSRGNPRDRRKERFWRRAVRQWRSSGLSIRDFCREEGLPEPNFYAWRSTIAKRDAQKVAFVPVQVVPEPVTPTRADEESAALELILAGGRRLRVGPGFDAATLQRLLPLVEGSRP
jgi:transposase-like protein